MAEIIAAPRGRRIGVLGLGISGTAMALYLAHRGAHVVGLDQRTHLDDDALKAAGIELRLGPSVATGDLEALALSPGAHPHQPLVQALLQAHKPVFGELELAGTLPAPVAAITGTNGKSTTTALLGALVQSLGKSAFVGGNLGEPILGWLDAGPPVDFAVLELSSYQLETAYHFAPEVGLVLNVTPDHLERYGDMGVYAAVKELLVRSVQRSGVTILNAADPLVRRMASSAQGRVWWFCTDDDIELPGDGVRLVGDTLVPSGALQDFGEVSLRHPRLFGRHNRENALAAFLAAHALGLAPQARSLLPGYLSFEGLEHRLELAGEVQGVCYINDSKATNDSSAATALYAMDRPVILLAGGKDKGGGYQETVQAAQVAQVRLVVTFGAAAQKIAAAFADGPEIVVCKSMLQACQVAAERAQDGDAVLLAPACSSFDEFTNYEQRGRVFKAWVKSLDAVRP